MIIMNVLSVEQMEKTHGGSAVACGISTVLLLGAFVGLGMCTAGVGWAVLGVASYASSLAGLVYECSR